MATHLAAVLNAKDEHFRVQSRPTPKPGPGELLVGVRSVAINPADGIMRNTGLMVPNYPTVIGFDFAGLVLEVGDDVSTSIRDGKTTGSYFQPGITRIAGYAASVWKSCDPDYGAFQEKLIVPWQHTVCLPSEEITWSQAATLPVAVQVALNAWDIIGVGPSNEDGAHRASTPEKEALLIWGASSSVGTMGVQTGRIMRDDPDSSVSAVYATAGASNHAYIRSLGADKVFDYADTGAVDQIVSAAKEDGLVIRHCFLAKGELLSCQAVLKASMGGSENGVVQYGKIASAPPVDPNAESADRIETIFVLPSMADERIRLEQFHRWLGTWLGKNLAMGNVRPSPETEIVGTGLDAINVGLDRVLEGVSCAKLVVDIVSST